MCEVVMSPEIQSVQYRYEAQVENASRTVAVEVEEKLYEDRDRI